MAYLAMSRRYRPAGFAEVIGQGHVAKTLINAIKSNRVAHAYLFCGPHGVGKTSMARIFAKALNCTDGPSAEIPADCPICRDITAGNDPDVQEIDGASNNSVDQVRTLREQAGYVPARARFKIYIIDEVHMLSTSAFNALLKTLEEPPKHVKFILATTEPHKLLETVLSRCQRFDFRLVPAALISSYLNNLCQQEKIKVEADALAAIAAFASGSMRDGLVLLDQLISFCPDGITRANVELVRGVASVESVVAIYEAIITHDLKSALSAVDYVFQQGTNIGDFLDQLLSYGRDLMLLKVVGTSDNLLSYGPALIALKKQVKAVTLEKILLILEILTTARIRIRQRALTNPLLPLEMAVAHLAGLEGIDSVGNVIARIEELAESGALTGGMNLAAGQIQAITSSDPKNEEEKKEPAVKKKPEPISKQKPLAEKQAKIISKTPVTPAPTENVRTLSLAEVKELWPEIMTDIQENYQPDKAYLQDTLPVAVNNSVLTLELPPCGFFLMEQIEEKDRKQRITASISRVLGKKMNFNLLIAKNPKTEKSQNKSGKDAQNDILADPIIGQLITRFKCEVLNIE